MEFRRTPSTCRVIAATNALFLAFLVTILVSSVNGGVTFGDGLGDLASVMGLGLFLLGNFVIGVWAASTSSPKKCSVLLKTTIGAGLVLLYTLYRVTYGRGAVRPWNGEIFP